MLAKENIQHPIYNFYESIRNNPGQYRQLAYDNVLLTEFTCPLESRMQALWSQHNYFVYVLEGKKIWHTPAGSYELTKDTCVFVRKGASIIEQFFDAKFCVLIFFISDEFIRETLRAHIFQALPEEDQYPLVMPVQTDASLAGFVQSMLPYFSRNPQPDKSLLELKFRELLLNIAGNRQNRQTLSYFCSLLHEPAAVSLQKIMNDNFSYNLKLEDFAQLCNRSLSAFKRDFQKIYGMPPGKWLLERRLAQARLLLLNSDMPVGEVVYDCGFENLSHFSRVFRAQFGISPLAFRQKEKKG